MDKRSLFSISYPTFVIAVFLIILIATLAGGRPHIFVVLICIFLIISDVEHLFTYLSATCMSSSEKGLCRSSAHVLIQLFVFVLSYMSELFIYFDIYSLLDI